MSNQQLRYRFLILLLFLLPFAEAGAQERKGKKILIRHADELRYEKAQERNRLIGNVVFEHDGALMYCDSAWAYNRENKIRAFENVRINQGDTLFLTGDYLEYSGDTKLALVTGEEVRLRDPEMELVTTRLDLDRNSDIAYYATGGVITNDENVLESRKGFYHTESKIFNFKDSVVLTNPEYVIESDTLDYNSNTRFAYFSGPTTITSDSSFIYTEDGVYNTVEDIARFERGTYLYNNNKYLTGDSLYYEKKGDFGEVYGCVFIHDTTDNYIITGNYGEYLGSRDSAFVTEEPVYSIAQEGDTLHIHGDTLLSSMRRDSLDSYRLVQIFHKVKFFRSDIQGMCDSLTYATLDSIFRMYHNPILWNDSNQITGDTIYLTMRNNKLDSMKVYNNAFIISIVDATKDNQIKGRNMLGKFRNNELRKVFVNGNGQTIYYAKDDKKDWIGMNKSISSYITIKLNDSQVESIGFLKKPDATLYPLSKIPAGEDRLDGYHPFFNMRPRKKADIFIWKEEMREDVKVKPRPGTPEESVPDAMQKSNDSKNRPLSSGNQPEQETQKPLKPRAERTK